MLSRPRDPQGQFQGQILGQEVKVPQHVQIFKMAAVLESLFNTLSNNTNFVKIDPLGPEIQGFKGRPATPIFCKNLKIWLAVSPKPLTRLT